jgi:polyhydroxyalkanoate synthesis regulator phasin
MQIKINDTLRAYIEPLTESEYQALERSILTEGCRDALVLWEDVLVDGHNRYQICQEHGIPFKAIENTSFRSLEDVKLWMIDNNLGRRSISDYQRGVLALRKKEIMTARALELAAEAAAEDAKIAPPEDGEAPARKPAAMPLASREDIARAARLSSATIGQIEKIQKTATPELVEAVRAGTISINAAATVASLPEEVQLAAVAGGKKELQKAAKEVREMRAASRPAKEPKEAKTAPAVDYGDIPMDVQELRAENAALREKNAALLEEITVLQRRISELASA